MPLAGVQVIYRLASHFFPDLVLSQIKNAPATIMPAVNIAANISILCYFKIKFPILAKIMVSVIPATNIYQFIPTSISIIIKYFCRKYCDVIRCLMTHKICSMYKRGECQIIKSRLEEPRKLMIIRNHTTKC